jgi:DNA mismatch repair protein MutL
MSSVARKDNAAVAIRRLDQRTVSRIAAGEVVQRPSAAVKELLENCIDAGATAIQITIKAGGIALIQIQDNGCGIRKDDLHIVCERFTTSKISAFEDLQSVRTFGFRGEALSSIAHVSRLTITTKTADSPCAYRAVYEDGRPLALPLSGGGSSKSRDQGGSAEPQPCAGVNGTIISVENLFYNMLARREAFKNPNEEYQRILDVVSKYSIHFAISNISFTCRKHGQTTPDLHTLSSNKTIDNIRQVYGAGVSKELLPLCIDVNLPPPSKDGGGIEEEEEEEEGRAQGGTSRGSQRGRTCMLRGFVSNASFSMRRAVYIFFINNRLVECASLRRLFDSVYADILPKGSAPFVYVAMDLPPAMLDVNVHPTKKEVIFLHESVIIDRLHRCMTDIFASSNQSRTFPIQTVAFPSSCSSRDSPRPLAACSLPAPIASPSPGLMAAALSPRSDVRELSHGLKAQYEFEDSVDEDEEGGVGEDEQEGGSGEGSRKRRRIQEDRKKVRRSSDPSAGSASSSASRAVAPNKLIRTDPSLRRIDHCFSATRTANIKATPLCVDVSSINACYCCNVDVRSCRKDSIRSDEPLQVISMAEEEEEECVSPLGRQTGAPVLGTAQPNVLPRLVDSKSQLISVANLVAEINENLHSGVVQILDAMTFVGAVDSAFILVQVFDKYSTL